MLRHAVDNWTLELWVGPVESIEREEWLWDTKKTPLIWIERASFSSSVEIIGDAKR
jgi:hypothetical protein